MEYLHCARIQVLLVEQVVSTFELLLFFSSKFQNEAFCTDSFTFWCRKHCQQKHTRVKQSIKVLVFSYCKQWLVTWAGTFAVLCQESLRTGSAVSGLLLLPP